jgi:predicted PurR-regulated permease PerM
MESPHAEADDQGAEQPRTQSGIAMLVHIKRGVCLRVALAAVFMLEWARAFFIPLACSFLLALSLNAVVTRLRRLGIPRPLGAALVLSALVALTVAAILSLQNDAEDLLTQLPASARHLRHMLSAAASESTGWWQRLHVIARSAGAGAANSPGTVSTVVGPVSNLGFETTLIKGSLGAVTFVGQLVVVLFLVYFLLVARLPVPNRSRLVTREILHEMASQVQRFIGVLVFTNVLLGLLTWLAFSLLGLSHAALWGLVAGVLHFIPYVGPATMAGASALAASVQFESLGAGLLFAAVSLGLSTFIGIALTTWLTGRSVRMNAATVFVGLLFWGWLWGLPGLLLGAPLVMTMKVIADRLPALAWLSQALSHEPAQVAISVLPADSQQQPTD